MTEGELDELFLALQDEAKAECGIPKTAELDREDKYKLSRTRRWMAAYAIASLRDSLANAEKEIADLKYRLEAARMFTEVGEELPGEAIEKMKEIVRNIVLHRKVKK
jgi:hypothetical protein